MHFFMLAEDVLTFSIGNILCLKKVTIGKR